MCMMRGSSVERETLRPIWKKFGKGFYLIIKLRVCTGGRVYYWREDLLLFRSGLNSTSNRRRGVRWVGCRGKCRRRAWRQKSNGPLVRFLRSGVGTRKSWDLGSVARCSGFGCSNTGNRDSKRKGGFQRSSSVMGLSEDLIHKRRNLGSCRLRIQIRRLLCRIHELLVKISIFLDIYLDIRWLRKWVWKYCQASLKSYQFLTISIFYKF